MDAIRQIQEFNAGRDPERLLLKYRAMRASPFAFLRGTCHLFYARRPRGGVFKSAPLAWVCGDLHPYLLRALQPAEDRLSMTGSRQSLSELEQVIGTLGRVVAWAHLRSAGREDSVSTDELIDFGRRKKWMDLLLDASQQCALQVAKDAAAYNQAWDEGVFSA